MEKYILAFANILLCFNIFAEESDTVQIKEVVLDEVVVRSFKYDQNFRTQPISATTINRISIENRNVSSVKDLSSLVPNLFIPDYGSKLTSPVYIRGIGSKINSPSIGLYVDGIPYFEKSAFDFDMNEIESMEVLRGPQGSLYGRNTMGGLINVHTKSPLQHQETLITASAGNYTHLGGSVAHYGKIKDSFGYSVSANYSHSDGYFTNQYTGDKADNADSGSGRIRLEWQINPHLSLKVMQSFDYLDQGGYPYALVDAATGKTGAVNYNDYSSYKRRISSSGASLTYTAERFSINSQTAFQYLSDKQGVDQDFSAANTYFAIQNQQQSTFSQEVNIKSVTNGRYKWLFGVFAFHQTINNEVLLDMKIPNYTTEKWYDIPASGVSLYHQSVINDLLTDGLSLTAGLRYDYEQSSNDYSADTLFHTNGNTNPAAPFFSQLHFSQLTPKVALQYRFPNSQMLYASVTKGYKTGGFNSSFEQDKDRSFEPEYSWNYELGSKLSFWDGRLKADLCLFYIDWKNQQIYQPLPSGRGQMLTNAGRSESKGAEISLQGTVFNGLALYTNWGYTLATFKEYRRSATLDYAGKYLPFVPSQTFVVGGDYQIPLKSTKIDRLTLNLNYNGTGRIYWGEDNAVSHPYYGLLNGKIAVSKGIATLSVWAKNIANAEYSAYYFPLGREGFAQKGKPFTIGASITLKLK
ncbi:MAG: TonB-dependent receptor [Bacteroidales bacterium]|nr:TonB-dependent receptor [Bacteroidales bacterium]